MKISVILISYNQELYIKEALDGIQAQTKIPDEIIIADDCSTDRTQAIISEYVITNNLGDKWNLLFNNQNLGINRNLQNAIDQSTGDIIIAMAGDDIALPNKCQHTFDLFQKFPGVNIVTSGILKIDSNGKIIGRLIYNETICSDIKSTIKRGMPNVFPVGQSWRRSLFDIFGKLPSDVPNEDDQITFWGLISGGIYCSSDITVKYRVHSSSASAWLRNNQLDKDFFLRFISDMPVRKRHMELWSESLERVYIKDFESIRNLIKLKIETYIFLERISNTKFLERIVFFVKHNKVLCLREKYYVLVGKFGILSWRRIRRLIKK